MLQWSNKLLIRGTIVTRKRLFDSAAFEKQVCDWKG